MLNRLFGVTGVILLNLMIGANALAANPNHLLELQQTNQCVNCDLSGANLSGLNLSGAKLNGANLSNANLSNTNLSNADLIGANLTNADLIGANLDLANLDLAILTNTKASFNLLVGDYLINPPIQPALNNNTPQQQSYKP